MSAGEHEAAQVPAPGDYVEDADLGGDGVDVDGAAGENGSSRSGGIMEMLSSTSPSESPEAQDGTLSTSAKWYQHAELAIKKATGSTGTPAWVNLTMSALLLVAESSGVDLGGGESQSSSSPSESTESRSSSSDDGTPGQVVGTHDNGDTSIVG